MSWLGRGTLLGREARLPRPARGAAPRGKRETDTIAAPHRGTAMRHRLSHRWRLWFGLRLEQKRNAALPPKQMGGRRPQTARHMFFGKK